MTHIVGAHALTTVEHTNSRIPLPNMTYILGAHAVTVPFTMSYFDPYCRCTCTYNSGAYKLTDTPSYCDLQYVNLLSAGVRWKSCTFHRTPLTTKA